MATGARAGRRAAAVADLGAVGFDDLHRQFRSREEEKRATGINFDGPEEKGTRDVQSERHTFL